MLLCESIICNDEILLDGYSVARKHCESLLREKREIYDKDYD
jgi:hypothetical protein